MIEKTNLDTKRPVGRGVDAPVFHEGESIIASVKDADVTNSSTELNITASTENLSAKYKNPNNTQDTGIMYSDQK